MHEWYRRFRPKRLEDLVGQDMKVLSGFILKKTIPHAILLYGPSGTGKTTVARILAGHLNVDDTHHHEINAADSRGIDTIREIRSNYKKGVLGGGNRLYHFDEAHRLTTDSQSALLKPLEDPPEKAYFILSTTEPQKVLKTVKTRCTHVELKLLNGGAVWALLTAISIRAKMDPLPSEKLIDKIVDTAAGSARAAVVNLQAAAAAGKKDKDRIAAVGLPEIEAKSIELCRALMDTNVPWKKVAEILKAVAGEDVEKVRRGVLGYAQSSLLNGWGSPVLAAGVVEMFQYATYDSGWPGLTLMAYNVAKNRKG